MAEAISVEVVYALPERYWCESLCLPPGASVADALARATCLAEIPGLEVDAGRIAVHGQRVTLQTLLADGDRIELLRPLAADPKDVRRRRAAATRSGRR